jgi:hypothetical protein
MPGVPNAQAEPMGGRRSRRKTVRVPSSPPPRHGGEGSRMPERPQAFSVTGSDLSWLANGDSTNLGSPAISIRG